MAIQEGVIKNFIMTPKQLSWLEQITLSNVTSRQDSKEQRGVIMHVNIEDFQFTLM